MVEFKRLSENRARDAIDKSNIHPLDVVGAALIRNPVRYLCCRCFLWAVAELIPLNSFLRRPVSSSSLLSRAPPLPRRGGSSDALSPEEIVVEIKTENKNAASPDFVIKQHIEHRSQILRCRSKPPPPPPNLLILYKPPSSDPAMPRIAEVSWEVVSTFSTRRREKRIEMSMWVWESETNAKK